MGKLLSGVFFGWSLGANDSANIFGTGVATGTVRYRTAITLTALFVVVGAMAEGRKCMTTLDALSRLSAMGAFFCALAAGLTIAALTVLAIPASASQAVVGAVVGVGMIGDLRTVHLPTLGRIGLGWVMTPVAAGTLAAGLCHAYVLYGRIQIP
jgi:PiT family inorganic phosphate transporter